MYHNTLARYNGYFLAKETMKEVESTVASSANDNFSRTLKVYPAVTSDVVSAINGQLEEVIKKASLPIQRHKNSKWVDNSYTLVGWSRYYKLDYDNASITFKYVNSKSDTPDDRHEALCWLLRTFTQTEQYDNAFSVISFLGNEKLTRKNQELYTLAKAELYQKIDEKDSFLKAVQEASDIVKSRNNKARTNFIMGQLNQKLENNEDAYRNYKVSIRKSPTYEMSFYAKLYMAQVKTLGNEKDNKKIIKYYEKLLRDEKNLEFKDKIYYEMAKFEHKQDHFIPSINYLKQSLTANNANQNQKAYSYLLMAEIYDQDLQNYRQAAYYYDSTLTVLAKDEENYEEIKKRGTILKEFIEQLTIIETEDSLQRLANMDSIELISFLDKKIIEEEKKRKEELAQKEKLAKQKEQEKALQNNNLNLLNNAKGGGGSSNWYFYNPTSVSKGKATFTQKWGDRPLEDNWRRASKEKVAFEEEESEIEDNTASNQSQDTKSLEEANMLRKRAKMMKDIPFSPQALAKSNARLEEALYKLGQIYNLKLEEKKDASNTYERLVKQFPNHENKLEVYYILYLINKDIDIEKSNYYKNLLLNKYPNSIYAKLVLDPEYLLKNEKLNKQAQYKYAAAYDLHLNDKFDESTKICNEVIQSFPENDIMDKLEFLKALNIGLQDTTVLIFKREIENFINKFPESELIPLANEYLEGIKSFINNSIDNNKEPETGTISSIYKYDNTDLHYYIAVFSNEKLKQYKVQNKFAQYNDDNWSTEKYKTQPMIFGKEKFIIVVRQFKNAKKAMNYYSTINVTGDILKGLNKSDFDSFVISQTNFNTFYTSKKIEEYLSFFRNKYILNDNE